MDKTLTRRIEHIVTQHGQYSCEAYIFLMDALNDTQKRFKRHHHVSGQELLVGVREMALRDFGPLALPVFHHWGITTTEDIGRIVFTLVEHKVLHKQDEDSFASFENVFDLAEAFDQGYREQLKKAAQRAR